MYKHTTGPHLAKKGWKTQKMWTILKNLLTQCGVIVFPIISLVLSAQRNLTHWSLGICGRPWIIAALAVFDSAWLKGPFKSSVFKMRFFLFLFYCFFHLLMLFLTWQLWQMKCHIFRFRVPFLFILFFE